jgi:hypothetical protein
MFTLQRLKLLPSPYKYLAKTNVIERNSREILAIEIRGRWPQS